MFCFFVRKTKEAAGSTIRRCFSSPALECCSTDPTWTPGKWREKESDSSSDDESSAEKDRDVLKVYNESMTNIASLTDRTVEPLTFRLVSEWDNATASEKALCLEKVDEACLAVCSVIAPKDSERLLKAFHESTQENACSDDLQALVAAYKNAPSKNLKTQVLSLYATRYSGKFLKKIHEPFEKLSDRQIKKARAHAKNVGVGFTVEKLPSHRVRIDLVKLEHFLSFADQTHFYQDVAYVTRTLKLDSGERLVMPNVVRIVGRSTMIEQYFKYCCEEAFDPLGRSTLYRILQVREASQRKSLQGLDNTAAAGAEGFDTMQKIVDELKNAGASAKWCDDIRSNLKDGKRYLKTVYRVHCREDESACADHCRCFALSDPENPEFQRTCLHEHRVRCEDCESLQSTMRAIADEIESPSINLYSVDQKEDLKYDHTQAQEMILQWKAHLLRAENQERAKQNVINSLQLNSALVVMDWAMKFLQLKYREKQSEWFGKRGINWHVSCVITRNEADNGLEIVSYVHLFDSCAQDWYTVCAILKHLLRTIKRNKPNVNEVFLRSDEAGCYHNNSLIAAALDVGAEVGIKVMR